MYKIKQNLIFFIEKILKELFYYYIVKKIHR